jgi:hypothetical protein
MASSASSASYARLTLYPQSIFSPIIAYLRPVRRATYISIALVTFGSCLLYAFACSGEEGCSIGWGIEGRSTIGGAEWNDRCMEALKWSQDGEGKDGHPTSTTIRDTWEGGE